MPERRILACVSALVAVGYLLIGITHFMLPKGQIGSAPTLFASLAHDDTTVFRLHYWLFALTSLLAILLVLGFRPEAPRQPSLLLRYSRVLAAIGFAVTALEFLYVQKRALVIASHWDSLDAGARAALAALGIGRIDATWLFGFGLVGLWPAVLGIVALRSGAWPKPVAWLGFGLALGSVSVCVGALTGMFMFVNIGAALGGVVFSPLWFGALAIHYGRASAGSVAPASAPA